MRRLSTLACVLFALTPVACDQSAAEVFDAYRRFSDANDARLAAAAASGDQATFDATI